MTQPANAEAIATWSRMPEETVGAFGPEGDAGRRVLHNPHIFRLLGDVTGRTVLDAGCGQGYLARLLAGRGARVTGVEPAEAPYRYAIAREREAGNPPGDHDSAPSHDDRIATLTLSGHPLVPLRGA